VKKTVKRGPDKKPRKVGGAAVTVPPDTETPTPEPSPTGRKKRPLDTIAPKGTPAGDTVANMTVAMFIFYLALGHDAAAAAKKVGRSKSWGSLLLRENPEIAEGLERYRREAVDESLIDWKDMLPRAKRRMAQMIDSLDEKVAFWACKYVVERMEGRVPQTINVETTDTGLSLASIAVRFAMSLHILRGVPLSAALEYAAKNADEVTQWGRERGSLPPGRDVG
jgi:hypothetical protein